MQASDRDTIVAVATAPGEGAIGIVRLSGERALEISGPFFRGPKPLSDLADRRLTHGRFVVDGQDLDEVLAAVMRAPYSYTGEDTIEFNCHGGPLLLRRAVQALVSAGARPAEKGEFTQRAFLNGKIDLTQAEAVADLISARADLGLQSAFFHLRGGLKTRLESVAEDLLQAAANLEASLDFAEDVEVDHRMVDRLLKKARCECQDLISSYRRGKLVRDGALITLAGRPNVGKSTLLNRLLEEERAIVTPIPGTTRDTIEESVELDGLRVTFVDTAGLRQTGDPIEIQGTRRSYSFIHRSDLVLILVDGSSPPVQADIALLRELEKLRALLVFNKIDLGFDPLWEACVQTLPCLSISALSGQGIEVLRRQVRDSILGETPVQFEGLTHERHRECLERGLESLARALEALAASSPSELVALEIRLALDALGEIVGQVTPQDVLDRIFQTFCIGK